MFGKELKVKKNKFKFTQGTDPATDKLINFMLDDSIACPQFLPMEEDDCHVTKQALYCASINEEIPVSEYVRKQFFYNCYKKFTQAISADPALIKVEIVKKLRYFDKMYLLHKTE